MRTEILTYLQTISGATLGTFKVSEQLPWLDNGAPLAHHNKKHIYIDLPQSNQSPVFDAFNDAGAVEETTTIRVFFVNDAKQLSSNYFDLVAAIKEARTLPTISGYTSRLCQVRATFNNDAVETEIEFSFKKLLTN